MYVVLVALYPDNPQVSDWLGIGDAARSSFGVTADGAARTRACSSGACCSCGRARSAGLVAELEAGVPRIDGPVPPSGSGGRSGTRTRRRGRRGAGAAALASRAPGDTPARRGAPAWSPPGTTARPGRSMGPIAWLRARVAETPFRPDRSAGLDGERGGRLGPARPVDPDRAGGRRDVPADLPAGRARPDALRRGLPRPHGHGVPPGLALRDLSHNIYEWTHPHLAKYAMARGHRRCSRATTWTRRATSASPSGTRWSSRGARTRSTRTRGRRPGVGRDRLGADRLRPRRRGAWSPAGRCRARAPSRSTTRATQLLVGTDAGAVLALDTTALDGAPAVRPRRPRRSTSTRSSRSTGRSGRSPAYTRRRACRGAARRRPRGGRGPRQRARSLATVTVDGATVLAPVAGHRCARRHARRGRGRRRRGGRAGRASWAATRHAYLAPAPGPDSETVAMDAVPTTEASARQLQKAIDDGTLAGLDFQPVTTMAVGGASGITFLEAGGTTIATVDIRHGVAGMAEVTNIDDGSQLYVTTTDAVTGTARDLDRGRDRRRGQERAGADRSRSRSRRAGTRVVYDVASELVEVQGATPDGTGTTVYVVEPHGTDAVVRRPPAAVRARGARARPQQGLPVHQPRRAAGLRCRRRGRIDGRRLVPLLVAPARGDPRGPDGRHPVPARRGCCSGGARSACWSGCSRCTDGMFFVQSRIAMNDVYTGFFILAAYLLFAWMWLEPEKVRRWFWVGDAGHGRAARPRPRVEVGRGVRDRRAGHPGPRPQSPSGA